MASTEVEGQNDRNESKIAAISKYLKLKPLTAENILTWYVPSVGGVSYSLFSVHIFNPNFLESLFPRNRYMVANTLLFNSHLGTILYLTRSKHLSTLGVQNRALYGIYGALLFNFGSILLWAVTKSVLPEDGWIRTIFSVSSSACMLFIGKEYVDHIDNWSSEKH